MRFILLTAFLLFSPSNVLVSESNTEVSEITVLQINTKWNKNHNIDLKQLKGCVIKFGWLEDQPQSLRSQIQTVPVIVIFKNNEPKRQWAADLSFKLDIDLKEIQNVVNTL